MKTYALMAANVASWGYCAWSGLGLVKAIHPSRGQIEFYLVFPLLMVAIALVFPVVLRRTRWSGGSGAVLIATLFLLIPYGLVLTRGA
jgi:hypothetical protein